MACAQRGGYFRDALIQRNRGESGRLGEDIAILVSQLRPAFAKWVNQDLDERHERSDNTKLVALSGLEKWPDPSEEIPDVPR